MIGQQAPDLPEHPLRPLAHARHRRQAGDHAGFLRRARQIADTLIPKLPQLGAASLAGQIQSFYAPESSGRFIRITRPDGRPVYCSGPPQDQSFDPTNLATTALSNAPGTRTLTLGIGSPLALLRGLAFVADAPATPLDPSTALPVQIYMWANEAERAFVERMSGAIIILLVFLMAMNITAIVLRRRFERRW